MGVSVKNVEAVTNEVTFNEMETGYLYKHADSKASTVYVKTLQGKLVWFEPADSSLASHKEATGTRRIGSSDNPFGSKFVKAPLGTEVLLTND